MYKPSRMNTQRKRGYWHSGVRVMPSWCQRNVVNWARVCGSSWPICIPDNVSNSPNNVLRWVNAEMLPKTFVEGTMDGPCTGPHSADFLSGACIFSFGSAWLDTELYSSKSLTIIAGGSLRILAPRLVFPFLGCMARRWQTISLQAEKATSSSGLGPEGYHCQRLLCTISLSHWRATCKFIAVDQRPPAKSA